MNAYEKRIIKAHKGGRTAILGNTRLTPVELVDFSKAMNQSGRKRGDFIMYLIELWEESHKMTCECGLTWVDTLQCSVCGFYDYGFPGISNE